MGRCLHRLQHRTVGTIDERAPGRPSCVSGRAEFGCRVRPRPAPRQRAPRQPVVSSREQFDAPSTPRDRRICRDPLDELVETLRPQALAGNPIVAREYRLALAAAARHARTPRPRRVDLCRRPEWIALRTAVLQALEPSPRPVSPSPTRWPTL